MAERTGRLLGIITQLLSRGRVSAPALAQRYEVSVKTIYRDIDALAMAGIPVVSHPGSGGGFSLMQGYGIPNTFYTQDELSAFLPVLDGIAHLFDQPFMLDIKDKLLSLLPDAQRHAMQAAMRQFIFDPTPWGDSAPTKDKLAIIRTALLQGRTLRFGYTNLNGEQRQRHVAPLAVVLKAHAWYLQGWCMDADAQRLFRLSRMQIPTQTEVGFDATQFCTTDTNKAQQVEGFPDMPMVTVVMQLQPCVRVRVEQEIDASRVEQTPDGRLIARIHYPEEEDLYRMLLSFGPHVRVLQPDHIITGLRQRALLIAQQYDSSILNTKE